MAIRVSIGLMTGLFAAFTLLTDVAQLRHFSFQAYVYFALLLFLLSVMLLAYFAFSLWKLYPLTLRATLSSVLARCTPLLVMSLIGGALAVLSIRPDADDYYYLPNAIYFLQHPLEPMDYAIHFLYSGDSGPFISHRWATASAFEYLSSVVAFTLHLPYLHVYYIILPFLMGFLFTTSLYYALSFFVQDRLASFFGLALALGILLLLGETHRTPLNFTFTRIFQGKGAALAVGVPLFLAESLYFFQYRTYTSWLFLSAIGIAMVGASTSSIVLLPPQAFAILTAYVIVYRAGASLKPIHILLYIACLWYPLIYGTFLRLGGTSPPSDSLPNENWPTTFIGHASFLVNIAFPLTPVCACLAAAISLILLSQRRRLLLGLYILLLFTTFLNPLLAPIVIHHVTTPNVYWRLFYLIPISLLVGISTALALLHFKRYGSTAMQRFSVTASCLLILAHIVTPYGYFRGDGMWNQSWARSHAVGVLAAFWKLPLEPLVIAKQVVEIAPPGVMLAPDNIAGIVQLLDSDYPQLRVRMSAERFWWSLYSDASVATDYIRASEFLAGEVEGYESFVRVIENERQLCSIVLDEKVYSRSGIQSLLISHGFTQSEAMGDHIIVFRPQNNDASRGYSCNRVPHLIAFPNPHSNAQVQSAYWSSPIVALHNRNAAS